jgi:hypothetical protein
MILTATFVALAPVAFAQTSGNMGNRSNPGASGPPGSMDYMGHMGGGSSGHMGKGSGGQMTGQAESGNCGTPDEPKPCPPMPRTPLQNYPANR